MSYQFTGTVLMIGELEHVGAKGFQKRMVVIDDNADEYPQQVPFEFVGKKANEPNAKGIRVGDKVTVKFDLRGREWKGKYYGNNSAWDINRLGAAQQPQQSDPNQYELDSEDDPLDEDVPF